MFKNVTKIVNTIWRDNSSMRWAKLRFEAAAAASAGGGGPTDAGTSAMLGEGTGAIGRPPKWTGAAAAGRAPTALPNATAGRTDALGGAGIITAPLPRPNPQGCAGGGRPAMVDWNIHWSLSAK